MVDWAGWLVIGSSHAVGSEKRIKRKYSGKSAIHGDIYWIVWEILIKGITVELLAVEGVCIVMLWF